MLNKFFLILLSSIFLACSSDYGITENINPPDAGVTEPEIEVDPTHYSYGALSAGSETQNVIINIENIGNGDLNVSNVYLHNGNSNFSLRINV